jgi:hypothetical protein
MVMLTVAVLSAPCESFSAKLKLSVPLKSALS